MGKVSWRQGDSFSGLGAYMKAMMKRTPFALLLMSIPAFLIGSAGAQTVPDPALQRAQTQAQVDQQLQQTQHNNLQTQQSVQQNQIQQQQLFNSMPPPAYQQPAWQQPQFVPPPAPPPK